jgi:hypothetical protein
MIAPAVIELGITFYDEMRRSHLDDHTARHAAVSYMRRKDADAGDSMPYYEALARALADRAQERIRGAEALSVLAPQGNA